jgi:hypothetical protein
MKNIYFNKKVFTIVIILIFISVSIQPAFADVSIESFNSELGEITVQFYETDRTYNHTVMLTKEQAEELDNLITDFEIKLNNAYNKIESEAIYKDTVVSLNDYGILPEEMSVERAQRLVTGKEHNPRVVKLFERWYKRNHEKMGDNENILCLIAGNNIDGFDSLIGRRVIIISKSLRNSLMMTLHNLSQKYPKLRDFIYKIVGLIDSLCFKFIQPFKVGFELFFGEKSIKRGVTNYFPCSGEIITLGLNGITHYKGDFYGQLPLLPVLMIHSNIFIEYYYSGAVGYTGISLRLRDPEQFPYYFLLGSALWFKIGEEHP